MEGIKNFLESSTIHGLTYISTTRKFVRLFWIAVVIAGFTCASVLIYTAFQDWHDNPIKTTIETLPIKDIKFPKVTVCPPKSYTNLNYDLMMTRNMSLDDDTRNELTHFAMKLVDGENFEMIMKNLSMFHEENRFFNWYHGYTKVELPQFTSSEIHYGKRINMNTNNFHLTTSAASGSISTQNIQNVLHKQTGWIKMYVALFLPKKNASKTDEIQLHLEINRTKVMESNGNDSFAIGTKDQYTDASHITINVTKQWSVFTLLHEDAFYASNIEYKMFLKNGVNEQENIPGLTVKWYYTGECLESEGIGWYLNKNEPERYDLEMNEEFRKLVNLLLRYQNVKDLWQKVIETSVTIFQSESSMFMNLKCDDSNGFFKVRVESNFLSLLRTLEKTTSNESWLIENVRSYEMVEILSNLFEKNISDDILNTAGEMFIYLNHCPHGGNPLWIQFYKDLFLTYEPNVILMTLNRLMKTSQKDTAKKLFDYLEVHWDLQYRNITSRSADGRNLFQNETMLRYICVLHVHKQI